MIRILINNNRIAIRIGVVYMPQESRTTVQELAEYNKKIENEIEEASQNKQHILIIGDFNCKVVNKTNGNDNTITNGGRIQIELAKKHDLHLMVAREKCNGTWTRELGKEKSTLVHFSIIKADEEYNDKLEIVMDRIRATNKINCIEKHSNVI